MARDPKGITRFRLQNGFTQCQARSSEIKTNAFTSRILCVKWPLYSMPAVSAS